MHTILFLTSPAIPTTPTVGQFSESLSNSARNYPSAALKLAVSCDAILVRGLISVDVRVFKFNFLRVNRTFVPPTSPITATISF